MRVPGPLFILLLYLAAAHQEVHSCHSDGGEDEDKVTSTTSSNSAPTATTAGLCQSFVTISELCHSHLNYQCTTMDSLITYNMHVVPNEEAIFKDLAAILDQGCNCKNRSVDLFCHYVLPQCSLNNSTEPEVTLPCSQYCLEFVSKCLNDDSSLDNSSLSAVLVNQTLQEACGELPSSECWNGTTPFANCTEQNSETVDLTTVDLTTVDMTTVWSWTNSFSTIIPPTSHPPTPTSASDDPHAAPATTITVSRDGMQTTIKSDQNSAKTLIIVAASCAALMVLIIVAFVWFWLRCRRKEMIKNETPSQTQSEGGDDTPPCTREVVINELYQPFGTTPYCVNGGDKVVSLGKKADSSDELYTQVKKKL